MSISEHISADTRPYRPEDDPRLFPDATKPVSPSKPESQEAPPLYHEKLGLVTRKGVLTLLPRIEGDRPAGIRIDKEAEPRTYINSRSFEGTQLRIGEKTIPFLGHVVAIAIGDKPKLVYAPDTSVDAHVHVHRLHDRSE